MRADTIMPDHADTAVIDGVTIRKGTAAAFLHNAREWSHPDTPEHRRAELGRLIADDLPALRALGIFDVMAIRDERLAALVAER